MSKGTKHIVGFSGGVDSQATLRWVRNRYPAENIIAVNSNAGGNEAPPTKWFIEEYSAKVFPVVMIEPIIADMWKTPGAGRPFLREVWRGLREMAGHYRGHVRQYSAELAEARELGGRERE
jgi:NH3-dependent NAD+ synthetase